MRRREFIALFGGAAATWPVVARAQQPAILLKHLLQVFDKARTAAEKTCEYKFLYHFYPSLVISWYLP
jgi:hypothetical protein